MFCENCGTWLRSDYKYRCGCMTGSLIFFSSFEESKEPIRLGLSCVDWQLPGDQKSGIDRKFTVFKYAVSK